MSRLLRSLLLALPLACAGCPNPPNPPAPPAPPAPPPAAEAPAAPTALPEGDHVFPVVCGCTLPEVKKCSEWAVVDGVHVQITGDLGLGSMPFCGKSGLKARIEGSMQDGKLAATKLEVLE